MSDTLKITEKTLAIVKERLDLNGKGSIEDPIIIDSISKEVECIKFKNFTSHILVSGLTIFQIRINKSKNITIENCRMINLDINAAVNIKVKNSKIMYGELKYCRESLFKNNIFHRDFAAVEFSEKGSKKGDQFMKKFRFQMSIISFHIVFFLELIFFIASIVRESLIMLIITSFLLILFILPILPIIDGAKRMKLIKNLGQNRFKNNWYDILEDLESLFLKQKRKKLEVE